MNALHLRRLNALQTNRLPDPTSSHETRANAVLRPVVFGANDGLVSNLALVMGVAGANAAPAVIVLAGIAGLLAGAFSMGVGEYISVQSQRELLEFQLAFQRHQLKGAPEQEHRILRDIYVGRGFEPEEAARFVDRLFEQPEQATRLLIFEEVGLDERSIGSPLQAGGGSFLAFTLGAVIPLDSVPAVQRSDRLLREPGRELRGAPRARVRDQPVDAPVGRVQRGPPAPARGGGSSRHVRRWDAARGHPLTSAEAAHDDLGAFEREQELLRDLALESVLPMLELDITGTAISARRATRSPTG